MTSLKMAAEITRNLEALWILNYQLADGLMVNTIALDTAAVIEVTSQWSKLRKVHTDMFIASSFWCGVKFTIISIISIITMLNCFELHLLFRIFDCGFQQILLRCAIARPPPVRTIQSLNSIYILQETNILPW